MVLKCPNSGRWMAAETTYLHLLYVCFMTGLIDAHGRCLRDFIADALQCEPRRVYKFVAVTYLNFPSRLRCSPKPRHELTANDVQCLVALEAAQRDFFNALEVKLDRRAAREPALDLNWDILDV
ncbi:hypothetical protein SPRG_14488 [Saprolegnia parasitica CBS 223.65]|uniref:Uncharacterized protein n=1 Tax=Saprolegnia parasitica (strain CBS 223.65) TaxID=695850 RepID=A0A067C0B8_SAPPC|nr:hypothetical protein SPRG_14488 [Saprolegnia parasitica CBS 223.65]KDO20242.1 hypothetical protein SPRG_14488 [Saprolegnia parasitica CBS 223.65]|eukprot:XP_012209054.1 hypothetical protein SPRG_14488 [Saprolegnia parasitica CBS 223.65]